MENRINKSALSQLVIETERLILRQLQQEDADDLYVILSDPVTMQYYPRPYTKQETKDWIERSIKSYQEKGYGLWAVILKENNIFIGQCGISDQNINGKVVPEIGYQIYRTFWNKGYGTEAARASLQFGFNDLDLDEIYIHTYIKNLPSIKIAEKLGMIKTVEYEKVVSKNNETMRHVVYSLKRPV